MEQEEKRKRERNRKVEKLGKKCSKRKKLLNRYKMAPSCTLLVFLLPLPPRETVIHTGFRGG